jgi:uncharacterized protein (DUF1501 family)
VKRKEFLKITIPATVLPVVINGLSLKSFGAASPLAYLLQADPDNDRVLVIIQLQGGNDGLNMVIPIDKYSDYFNARSNIAISQGSILTLNNETRTGLHPSMSGLRTLYNEGKLGIVQSVGYPSPSFSHFRATDIWMSGSDSNQVLINGWAGRYLDYIYPGFPDGYPNTDMPDPLGIQIGSVTSMVFQGPGMSMGMSISNPTSFYNFISGVEDPAPGTLAGKELKYIRMVAKQTAQYSEVIKKAAQNVPNQAPYPASNSLADQLKIVALLVKGGLKTRIYMVSLGGFDTHSSQVTSGDTATGKHADLMKKVSDAIKAFQNDLSFLGVEKRVMGFTFSEFGRRIKSNSSYGTDHGAAAPQFVFGSSANPMIHGTNPAIPAIVTVNDNIPMQYDFRSVYASLLQDWLGVKNEDLQQVMLKNFQNIPLLKSTTSIEDNPNNTANTLIENYPNPFTQYTSIKFISDGGHTLIQIINQIGQVVDTPVDKEYDVPGTYTVQWDSRNHRPGIYYARLQNGRVQQVRTMMKVR